VALTHLVDTSVLTRLGQPQIRAAVEPAATRGELARAGITDLEIGYSARSAAEWDRLMAALQVFELVETTSDHLRRARQVQRLLAARSPHRRRGRSASPKRAPLRCRLRSHRGGDRPILRVGRTCRFGPVIRSRRMLEPQAATSSYPDEFVHEVVPMAVADGDAGRLRRPIPRAHPPEGCFVHSKTMGHPALIPHERAGSSRQLPAIPATPGS
jgi:predicted nucleic acid-binding protein